MPITLYSYKLRRWVPLLTDEEFEPIALSVGSMIERIKRYMKDQRSSLTEARLRCCDDLLAYYEDLSGVRLAHPDELFAVRLSYYGRICPSCSKLFRTPRAKLCAECGFELPEGELAGPATIPGNVSLSLEGRDRSAAAGRHST